MAFPPESLCIELPDIPTVDDICFPGGFCLSYIWDAIGKIPTAADMNMDFFSQIGPAMSFLAPLFSVLDTVLAIFRCVKAVPDAITSLDPSELFNCMPALAELIDKLLDLLPYLSLPKMVKAIINNLAALLRSIAMEFEYLKSQIQRIIDLIDRAADLGDVKMNGFLVCAQDNTNKGILSTAEALKGIGRIILLVNILMQLFGGPEIPCFGDLIEGNILEGLDFIIDLLLELANLLAEIADSIPDPDFALTLALGEQKC